MPVQNKPRETDTKAVLVAGTGLMGIVMASTAQGLGSTLGVVMFLSSFGAANTYRKNVFKAIPSLISYAGDAAYGFVPDGQCIKVLVNTAAIALKLPTPKPPVPKLDTNGEWKERLVLTNKLVVGKSGSGKTFYLLSDVAQFVNAHPAGKLAIIDIDYGSSHRGQQPNYWFNLPYQGTNKVIFSSVDEGLNAIDIFYRELERRVEASRKRQDIDKPYWMLIIDELPAIILDLDDTKHKDPDTKETLPSEKETFIGRILQILRRGRKQNIYCSIGSQTLAVESTAIKTDALAQFDQVILGKSVKSKKYLGWMGITGKDSDDMLSRITEYSKQFERLALTREDEEIHIRAVPSIDLNSYEVEVGELDPTEEWFRQTLTPELEARLRLMSDETPQPSIIQVAGLFGLSESRCRNSNPKFLRVKDAWADLTQGDPNQGQ